MRTLLALFIVVAVTGCMTKPAPPPEIQAAAVKTFGTTENVRFLELYKTYSESLSIDFFGNTSRYYEVAGDMVSKDGSPVNLVVWGNSSAFTAKQIYGGLRVSPRPMPYLSLLFIGDARDAARIKGPVEDTGARFYFLNR